MRNILLYTIIVGLVFSGSVFLAKQEVALPDFGLSVFLPTQGGTGTSTAPSLNQILQGDGTGIYTLTTEPTFDSVSAGTLIVSTAVTGDLAMAGNDITNAGSITGTHFVATSTTATSTFAGGLTVDTSDFVVDPDGGLVGIGTASPGYKLTVSSGDVAIDSTQKVYLDGGGDTYITESSANALNLFAGGFSMLSLSTSLISASQSTPWYIAGNVGIGTAIPGTKLSLNVGGDFNAQTWERTVGGYFTSLGYDSGRPYFTYYAPDYFTIGYGTVTHQAPTVNTLVLQNDGNVGIGTTTPDAQLTIHGTPSGTNPLLMLSRASSGQEWGLSPDNNYFNIFDYTNNASAPRLTIDTSGNVGIGTASPAQPLEVVGTTPLRLTRTGNASYDFTVSDIGAGDLQLLFDSVTTNTGFGFRPRNSGGTQVEALLIDPDGNVGIGTTTPSTLLHLEASAPTLTIKATGSTAGLLLENTGRQWLLLSDDSPDQLRFRDSTAGADRMVIDSSGNVGIGTASPVEDLHVHSGTASTRFNITNSTTGATVSDGLSIQMEGNEAYIWNYESSNMRFGTSNDTKMTINALGNVGIGTASPDRLLHIKKSASASGFGSPYAQIGGSEFSTANYATIGFGYISAAGQNPSAEIGAVLTSGTASGYSDIVFGTRSVTTNTAVSERMRITSDGNVGIGTTTPSGKLNIYTGSAGGAGTADSTADELVISGAGQSGITILTPSSSAGNIYFGDESDNNSGRISYSHSGNTMEFRTADTERMRIDGSGKVGIGTTTPAGMLDLYGASPKLSIDASSGSPELQFTDGGTDEFSIYYDTGSNFLAFNEGGVGNRMVIEDGGNVGIGTTSPVYLLSVENSSEGNTLQLYDTDGNCLLDPDSGSLVTTCSSDERLKTNIRDTGSAIDYLNKLRIKDYTVIASGVEATGVIAQEVQKTHPELVQELGDGFLGVTEISSWKLVKAIQELYSTIVKIVAVLKTHESRLDRLEAENEALKVRLEAIEAKL